MKKKSSILTFITAWWPGAGQMYLGYMKRGLSLMLIASLVFIIAFVLSMEFLTILLLVLWAYSFFDTFNLARRTPEEHNADPDKFVFDIDQLLAKDWHTVLSKRHKWVAVCLIAVGVYSLYDNIISPILWDIYRAYNVPFLGSFLTSIPTLAVALVLICVGIKLLKSTKPDNKTDDVVEYKGE